MLYSEHISSIAQLTGQGNINMTNKIKPLHYRIYLLTIWAEPGRENEASHMWRFCLKDPRTGQQRGFANLTELIIALHTELIENHQEALDKLEDKGVGSRE